MTAIRAELARAHRERQAKFYPTRPAPGIVNLSEAKAAARQAAEKARASAQAMADLAAAVAAERERLERLEDERGVVIRGGVPRMTVAAIARIVADVCGVTVAEIKSHHRSRAFGIPRHITYHAARKFSTASLPQIGRALGGKDHSSVLHGVRKIAARRQAEPAVEALVSEVERRIEIVLAGAAS